MQVNGGVVVLSEGLEVDAAEVDLVLAGEVSDAVGIAPALQRGRGLLYSTVIFFFHLHFLPILHFVPSENSIKTKKTLRFAPFHRAI